MTKRRPKGKGMFIGADLLESKPYRELSHPARTVLIEFLKRRRMEKAPSRNGFYGSWDIVNNGRIIFTYKAANVLYGISSKSFKACLKELVEKGLIDVSFQAPAGRGRLTSKYAISKRWEQFGSPRFAIRHMEDNPPRGGFNVPREGLEPMAMEPTI